MTTAKKALTKNLGRARAFTTIFDAGSLKPKPGDKRGGGQPSTEEKELLRAAVIFSIGALDSYLSDVAAEVMVAQLRKAQTSPTPEARALLRAVLKEVDTLAIELALVEKDADRYDVAQRALEEHLNSKVSNHGSKAVSTTLLRMGIKKPDWDSLDQAKACQDAMTTSLKNSPAVLDYWTEQRHKMVHQGKAVAVKSAQARKLIAFVAALGDYVDQEAEAAKKI